MGKSWVYYSFILLVRNRLLDMYKNIKKCNLNFSEFLM